MTVQEARAPSSPVSCRWSIGIAGLAMSRLLTQCSTDCCKQPTGSSSKATPFGAPRLSHPGSSLINLRQKFNNPGGALARLEIHLKERKKPEPKTKIPTIQSALCLTVSYRRSRSPERPVTMPESSVTISGIRTYSSGLAHFTHVCSVYTHVAPVVASVFLTFRFSIYMSARQESDYVFRAAPVFGQGPAMPL